MNTWTCLLQAPTVQRVLATRNRDQATLASGNNILYLETETERILFDTGNGVPDDFGFGGQLVANLEAQGIARGSITRILLSHAHTDHIGGVLLNGGDTLAFPSATVHISRAEFDYWMGEGPPFSDSDLAPDILDGQIAFIPPVLEMVCPRMTSVSDRAEFEPNHRIAQHMDTYRLRNLAPTQAMHAPPHSTPRAPMQCSHSDVIPPFPPECRDALLCRAARVPSGANTDAYVTRPTTDSPLTAH